LIASAQVTLYLRFQEPGRLYLVPTNVLKPPAWVSSSPSLRPIGIRRGFPVLRTVLCSFRTMALAARSMSAIVARQSSPRNNLRKSAQSVDKENIRRFHRFSQITISEFEEEFLAYVVDPTSRQTVAELLRPQLAERYLGREVGQQGAPPPFDNRNYRRRPLSSLIARRPPLLPSGH
jgi:hypothetical protein